MNIIHIKEPYWAKKAVGIAENKIGKGCVVMIDYKDKNGNYVFPGQYYLSENLARKCVRMIKKNTPTLRIVPIKEMEEI